MKRRENVREATNVFTLIHAHTHTHVEKEWNTVCSGRSGEEKSIDVAVK